MLTVAPMASRTECTHDLHVASTLVICESVNVVGIDPDSLDHQTMPHTISFSALARFCGLGKSLCMCFQRHRFVGRLQETRESWATLAKRSCPDPPFFSFSTLLLLFLFFFLFACKTVRIAQENRAYLCSSRQTRAPILRGKKKRIGDETGALW